MSWEGSTTKREEIKRLIAMHRHADGAYYDETLNAVEKAIDDLVEAETLREITDERRKLAANFLAVLIEKHDGENREAAFDRALAGRAVAYADDLLRTLREREVS